MSTGSFSPKSPHPGFVRRWLLQSAALMARRAFVISATALGSSFVIGIVLLSGVLLALKGGASIAAIETAGKLVGAGLAQFALLAILAEFAVADGHELREKIPYLSSWSTMMTILGIYFLFVIVFQMAGMSDLGSPPASDLRDAVYGALPDKWRIVAMIVDIGAEQAVVGLYQVAFLGFFAWPLVLMAGLPASAASVCGHLVVLKLLGIYLSTLMTVFLAVGLLTSLPFFVSLPAAVLFVGWVYVGAREIFIGVTQNMPQRAGRAIASPGTA